MPIADMNGPAGTPFRRMRECEASTILISVNSPGCVSTSIVPACCFTMISWLMGEAKAGPLSSWLGGEERIEHLVLYFRWDAGAVIPNPNFHAISKASWSRPKRVGS